MGEDVTRVVPRTHRALIVALVRAHVTNPGSVVPAPELARVGWPGERIAWSVAANRLRVALAALRRHGLSGILQHTPGAYGLAANARVGLLGVDLDDGVGPRESIGPAEDVAD